MANPMHGTLAASAVTTVNLDADYFEVEVLNVDGVAAIYVLVDPGATAPTVAGNGCDVLPAAIGSIRLSAAASGSTVVKLISAGTPKYSVKGLR